MEQEINDIKNIIREEMPTREEIMIPISHDKPEGDGISTEKNIIQFEEDMLISPYIWTIFFVCSFNKNEKNRDTKVN